jgi:tRNA-splicing ligase RtcB
LTNQTIDQVLNKGMKYLLERKMCWPEDLEHCEENGCMEGADASKVSSRAKKRGLNQCGTLGSGNHYAEVQVVDEIYDQKAAETMGLKKGNVCVMIHSGSRGLGHQVCTDFLKIMERTMSKQGIKVNDRQLAACKIRSPEGKDYLAAMAAACNFAFCNRAVMAHVTREAFSETFNKSAKELGLDLVYDVCHNTAKFEKHFNKEGKEMDLLVHRKGATRAFGPKQEKIPKDYQSIGQPVLIGGTMGTYSYVLVGTDTSMRDAYGSTCHGAGRFMSRTKAMNNISSKDVANKLKEQGVILRVVKKPLVAEEAPGAYKDVNEVVQVCHDAGLSSKVVRLRPLGVVKG